MESIGAIDIGLAVAFIGVPIVGYALASWRLKRQQRGEPQRTRRRPDSGDSPMGIFGDDTRPSSHHSDSGGGDFGGGDGGGGGD